VIHIMNSAVMPAGNFGTYRYAPAKLKDLQDVVAGLHGRWQSAVGYAQNIALIEQWTGVQIPLNRGETVFADGDRAMVMRLMKRVTDPKLKGSPVSGDPSDWEFAWVSYTRETDSE